MNDLEINIALAKAMGWVEVSDSDYTNMRKTGFVVASDGIICAYNFCSLDFKFDYLDPVIFVAICKRWKLLVLHHASQVRCGYANEFNDMCIEKAAALCVIDTVKRGVK